MSGYIIHTAVEFQVLIGGEIAVKEGLMGNYADPAPDFLSIVFKTQAINQNPT
jgi:hypothetical protein